MMQLSIYLCRKSGKNNMKEKLKNLYNRYREMIVYIFWGGMSTVVSWGSYTLFAYLLAGITSDISILSMTISVTVFVANAMSWIFAVAFAFYTNKMFVFQSRSWKMDVWVGELVKFVSARIATGVLEILGVPFLVAIGLNQTILGIEGAVAKLALSVAVVVLNYIFSKLLIFKKQENK